MAILFALAAWIFIFEPERKTEIVKKSGETKIPLSLITKFCTVTLIASTLYFVYTLQFSLALDAIGIKDRTQLGNLSAIVSLAVPLGALIFKLFSKKSIRLQLIVMSSLLGVGLIGIGLSTEKMTMMIFAFVQQLGCGVTVPLLIAWGLNTLPPEFRGRGMGFWSSAFFLGQFISPLVVTAARTLSGSLLNAFVVFGVICLVMGVVNYLFTKEKKNSAAGSEIAAH